MANMKCGITERITAMFSSCQTRNVQLGLLEFWRHLNSTSTVFCFALFVLAASRPTFVFYQDFFWFSARHKLLKWDYSRGSPHFCYQSCIFISHPPARWLLWWLSASFSRLSHVMMRSMYSGSLRRSGIKQRIGNRFGKKKLESCFDNSPGRADLRFCWCFFFQIFVRSFFIAFSGC